MHLTHHEWKDNTLFLSEVGSYVYVNIPPHISKILIKLNLIQFFCIDPVMNVIVVHPIVVLTLLSE